MKITRYIMTVVDFGQNGQCSGKAQILGSFKTEDEAKAYIDEDMRDFIDDNTNVDEDTGIAYCDYIIDVEAMSIHDEAYANGCEYNIEAININVDDELKA